MNSANMLNPNSNVFIPCRQICNIRCTLVGNEIVDHSDVVGASPVSIAPTTLSFATENLASMDQDWAKTTARHDLTHSIFGIYCALY